MALYWITPLVLLVAMSAGADDTVYFQAHRGGLREVPENTLAGYRYAWGLGGIPEMDVYTSKDGEMLCFHDTTLARTTDAAPPLDKAKPKDLTFAELRKLDAGKWFGERFAGERIPSLREAFAEMKGRPYRQAYLDLKDLDLEQLAGLIAEYGVAKQIIFCHNNQENCITLGELAPDVRTMLWIGGDEIKARFEEVANRGFQGLDQVQLHLYAEETDSEIRYLIKDRFLKKALKRCRKADVDLEVLPFEFDDASLHGLLDLGIRWYATDEPLRFARSVDEWRTRTALGAVVYMQAHRGGLDEAPENTLPAFEHAWGIPGAVPEVDVTTTKDGVLVCIHDDTLRRTTDAPDGVNDVPVSELTAAEVRKWNAAARFRGYEGKEIVPTLEEVLALMQGRPERQLYVDLKNVDFQQLKAMLIEYGVLERVIFVHGSVDTCRELLTVFPGSRTMTWLSGKPEDIKARFEALATEDFRGISQLQFHLRVEGRKPEITYVIEPEYIREAVRKTRAAGTELQVRPFLFDGTSLRGLIDAGVRWYVADAPAAFADAVKDATGTNR